MATPQPENGRRQGRVVQVPVIARGDVDLARIIPIWVASAAIHAVLLGALWLLLASLGSTTAASPQDTTVEQTTDLEPPQKEPDLTSTDIGLDPDLPTNFNLDRLDEV